MMLTELQLSYTPLHLAARADLTTCVERLLSIPGIDVNIKDEVSWCNEFYFILEYCMSFRNMYMYVLIKIFGMGCTSMP